MAEIPYESMNIQWFPGHMTKAKREMQESLQLVDVVCEILDARIPYSSRNPEIDDLRGDKPKLVLLNRTDLADPKVTEEWIRYWEEKETPVLPICGKSGKNINRIVPEVKKLISEKLEAYKAKGQAGRTIRIMILGIPNVGKSTVINQLAHRQLKPRCWMWKLLLLTLFYGLENTILTQFEIVINLILLLTQMDSNYWNWRQENAVFL